MKKHFLNSLNTLQKVAGQFDEESNLSKTNLLGSLSKMELPPAENLLHYHDLLLFLCAYPCNRRTQLLATKELNRIVLYGKKNKATENALPENEGLPFTNTVTRFSPDFLKWLLQHEDLKVAFDSFYNPSLSLNDILNISLPAVLKAETTAGLNNADLLQVLHINPDQYVPFLLGQLEELNDRPLLKELFIERMDLYIKLVPKNGKFSRALNVIKNPQPYYHRDLLKKFNPVRLINEPLPAMRIPAIKERQELHKAIKNAMALTVREIDPATFMQEDSMQVFELNRGLMLSVYSMIPQRQLPLETYFGFTFFKNGIPISYGGVWVFAKMAKIGLNIFDPFRGGESGYMLCELLRVLKQAFGVTYFEIEPSQFGLDNPDGISSGAFWFYHKYGFSPVDPQLNLLAENENQKIKSRKNYRSTSKTLLQFTQSNIGFNLEKKRPQNVLEITAKILTVINKGWPQNYSAVKQEAIHHFSKTVGLDAGKLSIDEKKVLEDIALWAMAMNIKSKTQLQLMKQMVVTKTKDDYAYQQNLLAFYNQ